MPCSDYRPSEDAFNKQLRLFWKATGEHWCKFMTDVENGVGYPQPNERHQPTDQMAWVKENSPEIHEWWVAHKEWDRIREEEER